MADSDVSAEGNGGPSDLDLMASTNVAFDLSTVAMFVVDETLRVVKANRAAQQMLACEELVGRSVTEFSVTDNMGRAKIENASWLSGELTHTAPPPMLPALLPEKVHSIALAMPATWSPPALDEPALL